MRVFHQRLKFFFVVLLLFQCSCEPLWNRQSSKDLPLVEELKKAPLLAGSFSDTKATDKIIILNFWASWCGPCQEETPSLLKQVQNFRDQVLLISINTEGNVKEAKKFMGLFPGFKNHNILVINDEDKSWSKKWGVTGVPETFILDKNKKLHKKFTGAVDFNHDEFKKVLSELSAPQAR